MPAPVIEAVTPDTASAGQQLVITGRNLDDVTEVWLGNVALDDLRVMPVDPDAQPPLLDATLGYAAPIYSDDAPDLPADWHFACAGRILEFRQSNPLIAAQFVLGSSPHVWAWRFQRYAVGGAALQPGAWNFSWWDTVGALGRSTAVQPAQPLTEDHLWAGAVHDAGDGTGTVTSYLGDAPRPLPRPDETEWTLGATAPLADYHPPTGANRITVGNYLHGSAAWPAQWNGYVYWCEIRTGTVPGEGEIIWRFDPAEWPGGATTTWTDPRGRAWTWQPDQPNLVIGTMRPGELGWQPYLIGTVPPALPGTVDVTVVNPAGSATLVDGFTFEPPPPPTITRVTPARGTAAGGTRVTVHGANLFDPFINTVYPLTDPEFSGDGTSVTGTTLPGRPGPVDVTIVGVTGTATLPGGFTYWLRTVRLLNNGRSLELDDCDAGYLVQSVEVGAPEVRAVGENRSRGDGTVDRTRLVGPRAIQVQMRLVEGPSSRLALFDRVGPFLHPGERSQLLIGFDPQADPRLYEVRADEWSAPWERPGDVEVTFSWRTAGAQPFGLSPDLHEVSLEPTADLLGRVYDLIHDRVYPRTGPSIAPVRNLGNVPTEWTAIVNGPLQGFTLRNITLDRQLAFPNLSIPGGQWVEIDSAAHTVLANGDPGASRYSAINFAASQWFRLDPGLNQLTVTSQTLSAPSQTFIRWRDAYML